MNSTFPERHLHRLKEWDYSQNGFYFITVCTNGKQKLLANVGNAVLGVPQAMTLTEIGKAVKNAWNKLNTIDPNVSTDYFCIMPNHIHGIIIIENQPECDPSERRGRRSLHSLVAGFKSVTTREYKQISGKNESLWQASFYDTVIRNESMLYEIRKYIDENPIKWFEDKYYL